MKRLLTLALLIAALGGCVVVPLGYPEHGRQGYGHGDWNYRGYGMDDGYRWHGHRGGRSWDYSGYHR